MPLRVLFVDDEQNVLDGLRRMLRPLRNEWEMDFVDSGAKGLEKLSVTPFDVVVSDMKMPGMNGAEFLEKVQQLYPSCARFVLSGHAEQDLILRAVGPSHQFLSKPCDPELLKAAIHRVSRLRALLENPDLKSLISRIRNLPSLPALYQELMTAIKNPEIGSQEISRIISRDLAMSAKLLQLVNSSFFGLPRHVTSVAEASTLLGLSTISSLAISAQIFSSFAVDKASGLDLDWLWNHSLRASSNARRIAGLLKLPNRDCGEATMAALLHDVGMLVLALAEPAAFASSQREADGAHGPRLLAAERARFKATHAQAGAYLLGLWGITPAILEAVLYHEAPLDCPARQPGVIAVVHVAERLAEGGDPDPEYLKACGLDGRLEEWKQACAVASPEDA